MKTAIERIIAASIAYSPLDAMNSEGHATAVARMAGGEGPIAATVVAEPIVGLAQQLAEEEGLWFGPTPGPGDSEGGDVYPPEGTAWVSPSRKANGVA
jgi:hypothetical protein